MATDQRTTQQAPKPKPEATTKTSREKKSKKQPQRGMGVAKLESLRAEEGLKKSSGPLNLPDHHFQLSSVPLHYVAANYGGGGSVVVNGGMFGVNRAGFVVQRISGNGGFSCGSSGGMVMEQVMVDPNPYVIGAPDQRVQVVSVRETSKELSSMPKMQSVPSDRCDTCRKKKRFNGENIGVHGSKDKCIQMLPISRGTTSCFGLNAGTIPSLAGNHTLGYGARASRTSYIGRNLDTQGVEVLAIHRKGNWSTRGGESVVMEYDFFPAAANKPDHHKDNEASVAVLGGGGSGSSSEASNPVDLSLKLSY